jgi:hypothetical protein
VALLAASLLTGCDFIEDVFHPGARDIQEATGVLVPSTVSLPVATILGGETVSGYPSCVDYTFKLEWVETTNLDADYIEAALKLAYDRWHEFVSMRINPVPREIPPSGIIGRGDFVFESPGATGKLDNAKTRYAQTCYNIVIHRYWPDGIATRTDWLATEPYRIAAFQQAIADVQAMMEEIQASPLYAGSSRLQQLYDYMADRIAYPNPIEQRGSFTFANTSKDRVIVFDTTDTGWLYEYYLGYAPEGNTTNYMLAYPGSGNSTPYAFPE